jgi:ribulose-5-phosphate 4-epimerase/fuculose-1-phosphate aldolase
VCSSDLELACARRAADEFGLGEGVCNHFSLALPDGRILINPQGVHWREMQPDDLVLLDADGRQIDGRHPVEPTAFFIHGAIHHQVPQAACVLHTHMPHATALTMIEGGRLAMAHQNALRFHEAIAYEDDYNGLALDTAEGERIARRMGQASVLFLANHGVIVTGPSVAWAFDDLYFLERACQTQVYAYMTGQKRRRVRQDVIATLRQQVAFGLEGGGVAPKGGSPAQRHFDALKRVLQRRGEGDYEA